jgi:hypothetical protein
MIAECPVSVIVSSGQLSELGCDRWMETGSCRLGVGPAIGWFRRPRCLNDHVRGALSGQRFDMWSETKHRVFSLKVALSVVVAGVMLLHEAGRGSGSPDR